MDEYANKQSWSFIKHSDLQLIQRPLWDPRYLFILWHPDSLSTKNHDQLRSLFIGLTREQGASAAYGKDTLIILEKRLVWAMYCKAVGQVQPFVAPEFIIHVVCWAKGYQSFSRELSSYRKHHINLLHKYSSVTSLAKDQIGERLNLTGTTRGLPSISIDDFNEHYSVIRELVIKQYDSIHRDPHLRLLLDMHNALYPSDLLSSPDDSSERVLVPGMHGGITPAFLYAVTSLTHFNHGASAASQAHSFCRIPNWTHAYYAECYLPLFMPLKCINLNPIAIASKRCKQISLIQDSRGNSETPSQFVYSYSWMPQDKRIDTLASCYDPAVAIVAKPLLPPYLIDISVITISHDPKNPPLGITQWVVFLQTNGLTITFVNPAQIPGLQYPVVRRYMRRAFQLGLGINVRSAPTLTNPSETNKAESGVLLGCALFYQHAVGVKYMKYLSQYQHKPSDDINHLFKSIHSQAVGFGLPDPVEPSYLPKLLTKLELKATEVAKSDTIRELLDVIRDLPNIMLVGDITEWILSLINIREEVKLSSYWNLLEDEIDLPSLCNRKDVSNLRRSSTLNKFTMASQATQNASGRGSSESSTEWMHNFMSTILLGLVVGMRIVTWDTWLLPLLNNDNTRVATCEPYQKNSLLELIPVRQDAGIDIPVTLKCPSGNVKFRLATTDQFNTVLAILIQHYQRWVDKGGVASTFRYLSGTFDERAVTHDSLKEPLSLRFRSTNTRTKRRTNNAELYSMDEATMSDPSVTINGHHRWHEGIFILVVLVQFSTRDYLIDKLIESMYTESYLTHMAFQESIKPMLGILRLVTRSMVRILQQNRTYFEKMQELIRGRKSAMSHAGKSASDPMRVIILEEIPDWDHCTQESLTRIGWSRKYDTTVHTTRVISCYTNLMSQDSVRWEFNYSDCSGLLYWAIAAVMQGITKVLSENGMQQNELIDWKIEIATGEDPARGIAIESKDLQSSAPSTWERCRTELDICELDDAEFLLNHTLQQDQEAQLVELTQQFNFSVEAVHDMKQTAKSRSTQVDEVEVPDWLITR